MPAHKVRFFFIVSVLRQKVDKPSRSNHIKKSKKYLQDAITTMKKTHNIDIEHQRRPLQENKY